MTISRHTVYRLFKYTVYVFLAMNVYWFFVSEHAAAKLQFSTGVPIADLIEAYAATIDTLAWVILLLMFELETSVLEDRHFTPGVIWTLQGVRVLCYVFIVYAFYGYIVNLGFLNDVSPLAGVGDLCSLPGAGWAYATGLDDYAAITAANCNSISTATAFLKFDTMPAVVDGAGLTALKGLAWIDVINAGVWLLVVLVLEIDVRLQEHNRYQGVAFYSSAAIKFVLYGTLLYAAIYWGLKGDFVDFWDAFLWLVAFAFIELNVVEWHLESRDEAAATGAP